MCCRSALPQHEWLLCYDDLSQPTYLSMSMNESPTKSPLNSWLATIYYQVNPMELLARNPWRTWMKPELWGVECLWTEEVSHSIHYIDNNLPQWLAQERCKSLESNVISVTVLRVACASLTSLHINKQGFRHRTRGTTCLNWWFTRRPWWTLQT